MGSLLLSLSGLTAEAAEALSGLTTEAAAEAAGDLPLSGLCLCGTLTLSLSLTLSASCALLPLSRLSLSGGSLGKEHGHCQSKRCRQTDEC